MFLTPTTNLASSPIATGMGRDQLGNPPPPPPLQGRIHLALEIRSTDSIGAKLDVSSIKTEYWWEKRRSEPTATTVCQTHWAWLAPVPLVRLVARTAGTPLLRPPTNSQGPTHCWVRHFPSVPPPPPPHPIPPHTEGAGYHTSHNTIPARQQESKIYDQGKRTGRPGMTYRCSCVCQMCAQKTLACRYLASNGFTPR